VDLARATRDPDWWERHDTSAPSWFALYLSLETVASELCAFEPSLVHGLLQTEEYAWGVEQLTVQAPDPAIVERHVRTRMVRQQHALGRTDPLRVRLVLGEAALLTSVDSDETMGRQHQHLRELSRRPYLDLRVLRFAAGPHPGYCGAFSILGFPDPDD